MDLDIQKNLNRIDELYEIARELAVHLSNEIARTDEMILEAEKEVLNNLLIHMDERGLTEEQIETDYIEHLDDLSDTLAVHSDFPSAIEIMPTLTYVDWTEHVDGNKMNAITLFFSSVGTTPNQDAWLKKVFDGVSAKESLDNFVELNKNFNDNDLTNEELLEHTEIAITNAENTLEIFEEQIRHILFAISGRLLLLKRESVK